MLSIDDILRMHEAPRAGGASLPVLQFVARPECMAGSDIDFRLVAQDREPLMQARREDSGGQLPGTVRLTRDCQVCGKEHEFDFPLTDRQRQVLERWLDDPDAGTKQPETAAVELTLDYRDPFRVLADSGYLHQSLGAVPRPPPPENRMEDPADRPVPRANRLYDEAFKMKATDPAGALRKMEESLKLFLQVGRDNSAAYVEITIAELSLNDDADLVRSLDRNRVRSLLEHARDTLAGDPIHAPKVEKALALLKKLVSLSPDRTQDDGASDGLAAE